MQEIEDERWREAARTLQLDLVGADGKSVPNDRGTQGDAMRGRIDGQRIHVRHGAYDAGDRTTAVGVALRRSLLLGLETQVYRDPAPASNRYGIVPRAVFSGSKSVEDGRAKALFEETSRGRELWAALHGLGALGWAELTDSRLRVQAEVFVNRAEGWVELIESAIQTAQLADAAREELPDLPWETGLRERFDAERQRLRLELDRRAFQLRGAVGPVTVSVRLAVVEGRYALDYSVTFAPALPEGERLGPRAPTSRLMRFLGRSKANGTWESSIEASALVRARLSATQLERVAAVGALGHVGVEGDTLRLRCFDLEAGCGGILDDLVGVASVIAGAPADPYRR